MGSQAEDTAGLCAPREGRGVGRDVGGGRSDGSNIGGIFESGSYILYLCALGAG